jgi:hypothetical protein
MIIMYVFASWKPIDWGIWTNNFNIGGLDSRDHQEGSWKLAKWQASHTWTPKWSPHLRGKHSFCPKLTLLPTCKRMTTEFFTVFSWKVHYSQQWTIWSWIRNERWLVSNKVPIVYIELFFNVKAKVDKYTPVRFCIVHIMIVRDNREQW